MIARSVAWLLLSTLLILPSIVSAQTEFRTGELSVVELGSESDYCAPAAPYGVNFTELYSAFGDLHCDFTVGEDPMCASVHERAIAYCLDQTALSYATLREAYIPALEHVPTRRHVSLCNSDGSPRVEQANELFQMDFEQTELAEPLNGYCQADVSPIGFSELSVAVAAVRPSMDYYIDRLGGEFNSVFISGGSTSGQPGSQGTALGAGWQTAILEGLAGFLADRAEQELMQWLARELRRRVCTDDDDDIQWLSETCSLLGRDDDFGQPLSGSVFVTAVRRDLESLPFQALDYFSSKYADELGFIASSDDLEALFGAVQAVADGSEPLLILAGLGENDSLRDGCAGPAPHRDVGCYLATVGVCVKHLAQLRRSERPGEQLVELLLEGSFIDDLQTLYGCTTGGPFCTALQSLDLGPLLQVAGHALAGDLSSTIEAVQLTGLLEDQGLTDVIQLIDAIEDLARALDHLGSSSASTMTQLERANFVLPRIFAVVRRGTALFGPASNVDVIVTAVDGATKAVIAILQGDYSSGFLELMGLVEDLEHVFSADGSVPTQLELPEGVSRYLRLFIELAQANSADGVRSILEAYAAPLGSWGIKQREVAFTASALVGFVGGYEIVTQDPERISNANDSMGGALGFFAPIGFDLTVPLSSQVPSSNLGLFLSLIDVGQLTWTRLTEASEETDDGVQAEGNTTAELTFAQVVSPGLYLRLGIANSPFVVGLGAAWAPELRDVRFSTQDELGDPVIIANEPLSLIRLGLFLAIDVTLFPISSGGS